jgi:hypothetical protein
VNRLACFPVILFLGVGVLCGCAPMQGAWTGGAVAGREVMFAPDDGSETGYQQQAKEAVGLVLKSQGFAVTADANLRLDVAISVRNPQVGLHGPAVGGATASGAGGDPGTSRARRSGTSMFCKADLYRMSVSVFDRARRAVVYKGSAEDQRCRQGDVPQLNALARVALAKLIKS